MPFKFLIIILLLVGCRHFEEKNDEAPKNLLSHFDDKNITVATLGSSCDAFTLKKLAQYIDYNKNIKLLQYRNTDSDYERATVIKQVLLGSKNGAEIIWALRGGYGTAKVVDILYNDADFISQMRAKTHYPFVVGYSDITVLHLFLSKEFGWKTVHSSVFFEILDDSKQNNFTVINKIFDGTKKATLDNLKPLNQQALQQKEISGQLTGGNLSVIQTSIGTKWQIDAKNKILFLEDCYEKPYRIDRMLYHLKSAGIFDYVEAIIFGDLCDESEVMAKVITNFATIIQLPIYKVDVFGHGQYNYPIVYNADGKIKIDKDIITLIQIF